MAPDLLATLTDLGRGLILAAWLPLVALGVSGLLSLGLILSTAPRRW
jgi:hypothetical protein